LSAIAVSHRCIVTAKRTGKSVPMGDRNVRFRSRIERRSAAAFSHSTLYDLDAIYRHAYVILVHVKDAISITVILTGVTFCSSEAVGLTWISNIRTVIGGVRDTVAIGIWLTVLSHIDSYDPEIAVRQMRFDGLLRHINHVEFAVACDMANANLILLRKSGRWECGNSHND
jgi:hypothetical protein